MTPGALSERRLGLQREPGDSVRGFPRHPLYLGPLGRGAAGEHRVKGLGRGEALIDVSTERLDLRPPRVRLKPGGFINRRCLRQRDDQHFRLAGVAEPHQRCDERISYPRGGRPQHLAVVSAGRVEQQQRVSRRGRVEYDEPPPRLRHQFRAGMEDRDFLGAGRFQVFLQHRPSVRVEVLSRHRENMVGVGPRLGYGVDAIPVSRSRASLFLSAGEMLDVRTTRVPLRT